MSISESTTKREKIRNRIETKGYLSLTGSLLEKTARKLKPITKIQFPSWVIALLFTAIVSAVGIGTSEYLGYKLPLPVFVLFLFSSSYIFITSLIVEHFINRILYFIKNSMLDAVETDSDFDHLENLLESLFSHKAQFRFGIFFSLVVHIGFIGLNQNLLNIVGWPLVAANIVLNFFHGIVMFYFINYIFGFVKRLSVYQYKLFEPNPSASEIIHKINSLLNRNFYTIIIFATILTVWLSYANQYGLPRLSVVLALVTSWGLGLGLLIIHYNTISSIIIAGKWRSLNRIQSEIKILQSKGGVIDVQTLEQMNKLLDYHERIKSTPNSLIDLTLLFSIINTFIIPLIGLLIGNIKDLLPVILNLW